MAPISNASTRVSGSPSSSLMTTPVRTGTRIPATCDAMARTDETTSEPRYGRRKPSSRTNVRQLLGDVLGGSSVGHGFVGYGSCSRPCPTSPRGAIPRLSRVARRRIRGAGARARRPLGRRPPPLGLHARGRGRRPRRVASGGLAARRRAHRPPPARRRASARRRRRRRAGRAARGRGHAARRVGSRASLASRIGDELGPPGLPLRRGRRGATAGVLPSRRARRARRGESRRESSSRTPARRGSIRARASRSSERARRSSPTTSCSPPTTSRSRARSHAPCAESSGGMPGVQAIGLLLPTSAAVQVSHERHRPRAGGAARRRRARARRGAGTRRGRRDRRARRARPGDASSTRRSARTPCIPDVDASRVLESVLASRLADVTGSIVLTGEDLTLAEVWDGRGRRSAGRARRLGTERMRAARELVEGIRGEHTYGVNTGFGRFVSAHIPEELTEELQLRLLRSHACGVGRAVPRRRRARGDAAARERAREGVLRRARRDRRAAARVPESRRAAVGARARLGRGQRRPRAARASRAAAGRRRAGASSTASSSTARRRCARSGSSRSASQSKEGLSLVNGTQFMAAMASLGVVRAKRLAATADLACALSLEALQGSRTSFLPAVHQRAAAQGAAGVRRERLAAARRLGDHRVPPLVRPRAGRVLAALRAAGARRVPRPPRLRRGDRRRRAERRDRQPARARRRGRDRLGRELPRTAARLRARRARDGRRRAREHLRAAHRAARQPDAVGGPAAVPRRGGRPELRVHDPAVRRRRARLGEQGARASRRASTRSRRARARRITCRWGTRPGSRRCACSTTPSARSRSSSSPGRRRSSSSRRCSRASGVRAVHDVVRAPVAAARRGPLAEQRTSSSSPRRSAQGAIVAAAEAEVGALA